MKIGVCTGGGDCPGLNAAIRAVVKHAVGTYGDEVIGITDSFDGLMTRPLDVYTLGLSDVTDILNRGGTILGTTNTGDPFKSDHQKAQLVKDAYNELGLDCIIVIGGDGTQTISSKLQKMGMNLIGVPKTIDNDLAATEVSIGFQTAVDVAADALIRLKSTAESHDRIMLLEVMGRDAGHIALHAGIAGGANAILIPEIPFTYDVVVKKIEERRAMGRYFSIVVVAEGAFEKGGQPVYKQAKTAKFATEHLGGIGAIVAEKLYELTKTDTRITVLGHIQRGGNPCAYDRVLASSFGVHAVDLAHQGKFGMVVGLNKGQLSEVSYEQVKELNRPLDLASQYIKTAEAIGICLGR